MILIQPPTVQNWNSLVNKPSILSDNQISWDEIQNKPTTLAGYGITNGQPLGNELTALQNLSDSAGFLKKLGDGTYSIDVNSYLSLTGGNVTGNLGLGVVSPTVKLSIGRLGGAFTVPTLNANTALLLTAGGGVAGSGSVISVLGGTTSQVGIVFGDTDASEQGGVYYLNSTDTLSLRAGNSVRISVDSTSTTFSGATESTSTTTGAIRAASLGITGAIFAGTVSANSYNLIPVGRGAGGASTNTAVGVNSLLANTTGTHCSAFGVSSLQANITGTHCSAFGVNAGRFQSDGVTEISVTNNSCFIGTSTRGTQNATNENVFGYNTTGNGSNTVTIGDSNITNNFFRGALSLNGTQVISTRRTGWAVPTGTATRTTFATSTVTLPQLAERVKALIDDLRTHGLIGA